MESMEKIEESIEMNEMELMEYIENSKTDEVMDEKEMEWMEECIQHSQTVDVQDVGESKEIEADIDEMEKAEEMEWIKWMEEMEEKEWMKWMEETEEEIKWTEWMEQMEQMAQPFDIESTWYNALFEEDCQEIMALLSEDASLVYEGWEDDPSRKVKGSWPNSWSLPVLREWKGRTALHAGARRGCVKLIKQISDIYMHGLHVAADEKHQFRRSGRLLQQRKDVTENVHAIDAIYYSKDGQYKLDAFAIAVLNGNLDVIIHLARLGILCSDNRYNFYQSLMRREVSKKVERKPFLGLEVWQKRARKIALNPKLRTIAETVIQERKSHISILRTIAAEAVEHAKVNYSETDFAARLVEGYAKHRDFSFLLPGDFSFLLPDQGEFMFHYLVAMPYIVEWDGDASSRNQGDLEESRREENEMLEDVGKFFWNKVKEEKEKDLWNFLLNLQDGQGRTPSHAAVDEEPSLRRFTQILDGEKEALGYALAVAVDGAGRTALHRAVALNRMSSVKVILDIIGFREDWMQPFHSARYEHPVMKALSDKIGWAFDIDSLSEANNFQGLKLLYQEDRIRGRQFPRDSVLLTVPFYSAIIHECKEFFSHWNGNWDDIPLIPYGVQLGGIEQRQIVFLGPLEFSLLVAQEGDTSLASFLMMSMGWYSNNRGSTRALSRRKKTYVCTFPPELGVYTRSPHAIHVAAACGNYKLLEFCVDAMHQDSDRFVEDYDGNTALHYALEGFPPFHAHLLDYVNCQHIMENDPRRGREPQRSPSFSNKSEEQEYCINQLVKLGFDMFKQNTQREAPYPKGWLKRHHSKLLPWWNGMQTKEFGVVQSTMSVAANAISVTAALVATASYVGPLQPPLGYDKNSGFLQMDHFWVRMFIICDTLSFYLALTAILCSLVPCLPLRQEAMIDELRITRKMVTWAIAILIPSVVLVLLAFAASSISVVSNDISSIGGTSTLITTALGATFFVVVGSLCVGRFLIVMYPANVYVKRMYKKLSYFYS